MSIRVQFLIFLSLVSLVAVSAIGYASYQFSKDTAIAEAESKVSILSAYTKASHHYYRTQSIPMVKQLVGKDRFYPELMSIFVMTRNIAEIFQKDQPGYTIKNATVDPLWQENKADHQELAVINKFRADPSLKKITGMMSRKGGTFYYEVTPYRVAKKCLRCHGDPLDAPKDQVMIYGETNGYHWKLGDTVSGLFVYVPLSDAMDQAKANAIKLVAVGAGGLLITLILVVVFLGVKVVGPIEELARRTDEVSLGKNLGAAINVNPNREIGSLSRAVDRLRLSIARFMKRK